MKIAFTTSGNNLESPLDQRFGRAAAFLVYDTDTEAYILIDNTQNLNAAQGAGIQSAQHVVNAGVSALITGHTGPKAFAVLQAAGIDVYLSSNATVREALKAWKHGSLEKSGAADVESHWI